MIMHIMINNKNQKQIEEYINFMSKIKHKVLNSKFLVFNNSSSEERIVNLIEYKFESLTLKSKNYNTIPKADIIKLLYEERNNKIFSNEDEAKLKMIYDFGKKNSICETMFQGCNHLVSCHSWLYLVNLNLQWYGFLMK